MLLSHVFLLVVTPGCILLSCADSDLRRVLAQVVVPSALLDAVMSNEDYALLTTFCTSLCKPLVAKHLSFGHRGVCHSNSDSSWPDRVSASWPDRVCEQWLKMKSSLSPSVHMGGTVIFQECMQRFLQFRLDCHGMTTATAHWAMRTRLAGFVQRGCWQ